MASTTTGLIRTGLLAIGILAAPGASASSYDGTWLVVLDCPNVDDSRGFTKGYTFTFPVLVTQGKLEGQYGVDGAPSSVHYSGEISDDGVIEIRARGITGPSEYAVGKVSRGSPYAYTMGGRVEAGHGQAQRREARRCTADFTKQ
ncbi:hypothetical protein BH10PSE17_BH10PSE17_08260 [soil metagenome]